MIPCLHFQLTLIFVAIQLNFCDGNPISRQFSKFTLSNLDSCVIHTFTETSHLDTSVRLSILMESSTATVTFAVSHYVETEAITTVYRNVRFSTCHVHLYLMETKEDFVTNIRKSFLHADYRHEDPRLILLWGNEKIVKEIGDHSFTEEFFTNQFPGIRLLLQDQPEGEIRLGLVCMICSKKHRSNFPILNFIQFPTKANILATWNLIYQNHHNLRIPHVCPNCQFGPNGRKNLGEGYLHPEYFVHLILNAKFNVTITSEPDRKRNNKYGLITRFFPIITGSNAYSFFFRKASPRYILVPYGILVSKYNLLTIMDQDPSTGNTNKFWVLLKPLPKGVWISMAVTYFPIAVCIYLMRSWLTEKNVWKDWSISFTTIFGAILEQPYHAKLYSRKVLPLIHLWAWSCIVINSLYKGELYANLTRIPVSNTPEDLDTLAKSDYKILSVQDSLSTLFPNMAPRSVLRSHFFSSLHLLAENYHSQKKSKIASMEKLFRTLLFCPYRKYLQKNMVEFITNSTCFSSEYGMHNATIHLPSEFVLVDLEKRTSTFKRLFELSGKWTSELSSIDEYRGWKPWLLQKTYFANLALPVLASWVESGLSDLWDMRKGEDSMKMDVQKYSEPPKQIYEKNDLISRDKETELKPLDYGVLLPLYEVYSWLCITNMVTLTLELVIKNCNWVKCICLYNFV